MIRLTRQPHEIANDNFQDWRKCQSQRGGAWEQYDKIEMTYFGPIGFKSEGFEYLWEQQEEERVEDDTIEKQTKDGTNQAVVDYFTRRKGGKP